MEATTFSANEKQLLQKEVVSSQTAKSLGKGLRQLLAEPLETLSNIKSLEYLREPLEGIKSMIFGLEKAKEVWLVPFSPDQPGDWDLKFSEEETEGIVSEPSTIIIDKNLTPKIISAVSHIINNSIQPIINATSQDTSEENAGIILASTQISKTIRPLLDAQTIQLSTDFEGKTSIAYLPRFSKSPFIPLTSQA